MIMFIVYAVVIIFGLNIVCAFLSEVVNGIERATKKDDGEFK